MKAWCYFWAFLWILGEYLDRLGDWMEDQIDHNDYLAGALGVVYIYFLVYLVGAAGVLLGGK